PSPQPIAARMPAERTRLRTKRIVGSPLSLVKLAQKGSCTFSPPLREPTAAQTVGSTPNATKCTEPSAMTAVIPPVCGPPNDSYQMADGPFGASRLGRGVRSIVCAVADPDAKQ